MDPSPDGVGDGVGDGIDREGHGRRGSSVERRVLFARGATMLAALAAQSLLEACGVAGTGEMPPAAAPRREDLHLRPAVDLLPAPGLAWFVQAEPKRLFADGGLDGALAALVRSADLDTFADAYGGLDPRQLDEILVARYDRTDLVLGMGALAPDRVERAFTKSVGSLEGRAVDRARNREGTPLAPITRMWGTCNDGTWDVGALLRRSGETAAVPVDNTDPVANTSTPPFAERGVESTSEGRRCQLALFGDGGFAFEQGRFGPLRAVEAFAQGRLHRAAPALRTPPLDQAASVAGPAAIRLFAPGPFRDDWARAAGGVLSSATALAVTVDRAPPDSDNGWDDAAVEKAKRNLTSPPSTDAAPKAHPGARLRVRTLIVGIAPEHAQDAALRLHRAFDAVAGSPLGRLCGLSAGTTQTRVSVEASNAVVLEVRLDALTLVRGLRAATVAGAGEMMNN